MSISPTDFLRQEQAKYNNFLNDVMTIGHPLDRVVPYSTSASRNMSSDIAEQWKMLESQQDFNANQALINRTFQQQSADKAMAFSAEEAAKNRLFQQESAQKAMDFSERMSNTSYQRAITDLKAAGLNPILAYAQGGSTSPTGVTSSGSSASGVASSGSTASSGLPSSSGMSNSKKTDLQFLQTIGNLVTSAAMLFALV